MGREQKSSSGSSSGVYSDSVYTNGVSSVSTLPWKCNGNNCRHDINYPTILYSEHKVNDDEKNETK